MDHVESVFELGAIKRLREEVSFMIGSGCFVNSHVAVVDRVLTGGDFVQQADGNAVDTKQVPHGGGVSLLDGGGHCLVVFHHHHVDGFVDKLLQEELGGQNV